MAANNMIGRQQQGDLGNSVLSKSTISSTSNTANTNPDLKANFNPHSSQRFVVAIDFGTSHSGFAYAHKANESMIEALYTWDFAPHPYSKTLTGLLYDTNQIPIAWGYAAQHKYLGMPPNTRSLHSLVTRFKLFLDESYDLEPPEGLSAIVLIGDYLKFMKEKISELLTSKFGSSFNLDEVQWCLTVPAMWSDGAKHFTRKAAAFAGLIDDPLSTKLSIILEPEAAAIYVSTNDPTAIQKGDVFMIIDAGGGTVDITVHQMRDTQNDKRFVEVAPGLGTFFFFFFFLAINAHMYTL
ncbi:hypothetical protein HMI55_003978 [Coelomomyces lativittatus]|nr:hypothetical protein HMI55_003978 [Coelomomyces lativittatus]